MSKGIVDPKQAKPQTALLYGFVQKGREPDFEEFTLLAESAGVEIIEQVAQRSTKPTPRHYISEGSVKALSELVELIKPDVVIFDCELKGSQRNNLENAFETPVIDRTELILDIFAIRANTKEGKLQVELAQLMYQLPRLLGMGKHMSALGGGIGTRGPGETKLETDRQRIKLKMASLKREIKSLEQHRSTQRKQRSKSSIPKISLVGYTNAGKSTLINKITGSTAYADNRLFATLDPLTRRGHLPSSNRDVLITDTVGFLRRIPTQLIAAFKATLEEINYSDLLLIVVDITDDDYEEKLHVVTNTLNEIGSGEIPHILVFNKIDLVDKASGVSPNGQVSVSAKNGNGIDLLLLEIDKILNEHSI
jgi:GTP-binding protein HflX